MKVVQTPTFLKVIKKLHANQKKDVDNAGRAIMDNPLIGEVKTTDLASYPSINSKWPSN